jgi:hypothetical protein
MDSQDVFFGIVAQSPWRLFTVCPVQARLFGLEPFPLRFLDDGIESTVLIPEVEFDTLRQAGGFQGESEIAIEIIRELVLSGDRSGVGIE